MHPGRAGSDVEACTRSAVDAIQKRYQSIRDFSARFEQTTRSVALGTGAGAEQASKGTVRFAKPGRMRWSYEAPQESLVVSDGRRRSFLSYGVSGTPTFVLVGEDGRIEWRQVGYSRKRALGLPE